MLSIIIPTFNEADQIEQTICRIHATKDKYAVEIIVVDAGSADDTVRMAGQNGAIVIQSERKGRGAQMNRGAAVARYDLLYFLHADSAPPAGFTARIIDACNNGTKSGCFRLAFDHHHWFLKANAWFTRFDVNAVRFGDQSLFVAKKIFEKAGGFREDLLLMEDQEIIHRLKQHGSFAVLDDYVITSARKYMDNGIYRMQGIFFRIWAMYYLGYSQQQMLKVHRRLIRKHKL